METSVNPRPPSQASERRELQVHLQGMSSIELRIMKAERRVQRSEEPGCQLANTTPTLISLGRSNEVFKPP